MTPQQKQQLEELAKWHEEEGFRMEVTLSAFYELADFHYNAAKLLREVVEL